MLGEPKSVIGLSLDILCTIHFHTPGPWGRSLTPTPPSSKGIPLLFRGGFAAELLGALIIPFPTPGVQG